MDMGIAIICIGSFTIFASAVKWLAAFFAEGRELLPVSSKVSVRLLIYVN